MVMGDGRKNRKKRKWRRKRVAKEGSNVQQIAMMIIIILQNGEKEQNME